MENELKKPPGVKQNVCDQLDDQQKRVQIDLRNRLKYGHIEEPNGKSYTVVLEQIEVLMIIHLREYHLN